MNEDPRIPTYSFWPIFAGTGILLVAVGVVSTFGISILGLLLLLTAIIGWVWENRAEKAGRE